MTNLSLRLIPDPCLRRKATNVKTIHPEIKHLTLEMLKVMRFHRGVGLAANQVGLTEKVAVIQSDHMPEPLVLINPEIIQRHGAREVTEGCLSVPGRTDLVTRSKRIRVTAMGIDGRPIKITAEDLLAQIIEHETDHLNGVVYTDHLDTNRHKPHPRTIEFLS